MNPLLPAPFLFRLSYSCPYVPQAWDRVACRFADLPDSARIDQRSQLSERKSFADLRLAWNESGLAVQVAIKGKDTPPVGDASRPRASDGLFLWLDTRDTRNIHRASRYCHQFYFLPTGGGNEADEPVCGQVKIHRALADAPVCSAGSIPLACDRLKSGYRLRAFLPGELLTGFDPETNPRLGFFYAVRDQELGEQTLGLTPEFPYWEDPSLWSTLELIRT